MISLKKSIAIWISRRSSSPSGKMPNEKHGKNAKKEICRGERGRNVSKISSVSPFPSLTPCLPRPLHDCRLIAHVIDDVLSYCISSNTHTHTNTHTHSDTHTHTHTHTQIHTHILRHTHTFVLTFSWRRPFHTERRRAIAFKSVDFCRKTVCVYVFA